MIKRLALILLFLAAPAFAQPAPTPLPLQFMTAAGSNLVAKNTGGSLYGFMVSTTTSTSGCIFVFNATSLPANGAVTPVLPPIYIAGNTTVAVTYSPSPPVFMSNGIVIGFSSNCSIASFTASTTALISAQVQ